MLSVQRKLGATVLAELEALCEANNGILQAEAVVNHARNPQSALHKRFTWDDTTAAHQYRLVQARQLIRYAVVYITKEETQIPVRGMLNLPSDRHMPGGGYRPTVNVMTNAAMRKEHLRELRQSVQRLQQRYKTMTELQPAFDAFDAAIAEQIERTNEIVGIAV